MKRFNNYLEHLCQGGSSYRWRCLSSPSGDFLEAYMAARVGALLPIEEIGPDGNMSIGLPLLLTDGGVLSTCKMIQR